MGLTKKFSDTKINFKLTVGFFVIAFLCILIIGLVAYFKGKSSLREESFNRLTAVREMKAAQIEDYFSDISNQIITFSEDHTIVDAMEAFTLGFDSIEAHIAHSLEELAAAEARLNLYYEDEYLSRLNVNTIISEHVANH